ncbi:DUF4097 domain-containing protein [Clostridioides difficile]|nr:DUF4097 domain-containing protein [Clostridioides difficile]
MKLKKQITICIAMATCMLTFTGCSHSQTSSLANELHFSLDDILNLTISYDEEKIAFFESESDELIIKEYMTTNKNSYHAKINQDSNSIKISEGSKPLFKGSFSRYIEVYLPTSYHENLTVTTTDGNIDFSNIEILLSSLHSDSTTGTIHFNVAKAKDIYLSSTSGTLKLGDLKANQIKIETTSGNVTCDKIDGNVTYTSTSGNANIKSAVGSGNYRINNSGNLNIKYAKVTDNLSFFNKNDDINIILPKDLEFEFIATTKNGLISTNFKRYITLEKRIAKGIIGSHPDITINVETNNGNINVTR